MPTGYTADVQSGKVTELNEFILRCARGMGACIMQREDDLNDPPKHRTPDDYYAKRIEELKVRIYDLQQMTWDEIVAAHAKAELDADAEYAKRCERTQAEQQRYKAMLAKVQQWKPPTPEHEGLKTFMLEQLTESIKFDCHTNEPPVRSTPSQWHMAQLAAARYSLGCSHTYHAEEIERCEKQNAWIDALYESLK